MGPLAAWVDGVRRVNRAPAVLVSMCALTLALAVPLAAVMRGLIAGHLGASLAADLAASGADFDWWQEFSSQASALATTFVPSVIGFAAVLENLTVLLDNEPLAAAVAGVTAAWMVIWSFLAGGVIDRYARNRPTRSAGFFAACGAHAWPLFRLGILALVVYYVYFQLVHGWILEDAYGWLIRDLDVERTAFFIRVGGYVIFGTLLVATNVVFDYARLRTVIEDRRSAIGALLAGVRFVARNPARVGGLYLLNAAAFVLVVAVYALVAPGARAATWTILLVGQAYIVARHYLKLLFYASETALFQGLLAHAGYTAAPAPRWPESAAVESIVNADPAVSA